MRVRLMGTRDECDAVAETVCNSVPEDCIRSVSAWYPNRGVGKEGRVYIEMDVPDEEVDE